MKLLSTMLSALVLLSPVQASADPFDGAVALANLMAQYKGRPAQELLDALGDATDQKQVLDNVVISGGFEQDDGPSCTWKIIADQHRIVKNVNVLGNPWPWACRPVAKSLKKYMKEHPLPE